MGARTWTLAALALLWIGAPLAPASQAASDERLAAAAERWSQLEPDQQAELERRFESFRALDEDQRAALRERAARLRTERLDLAEALPVAERAKLDALAPRERDAVLRRQHEELARRRGERLREVLPAPMLEGLRAAPPHDRPRLLHRWRDDLRERSLPRGERGLEGRLGLEPEQLARLRDLAPEERFQALRELARGRHRSVLPATVVQDAELFTELERASIPTVGELQAPGGPPDRDFLRERSRERVLALLRASGRLTPEELHAVEGLSPGRLLRGLRPRPPVDSKDGRRPPGGRWIERRFERGGERPPSRQRELR